MPTKYGTRKQYEEAIKAVQITRLQVYVDILLNHLADANETEKRMTKKVEKEEKYKN